MSFPLLNELKDLIGPKLEDEFTALLGPGKGHSRRCFSKASHSAEDRTPSLSFSPSRGHWKCHACGAKGGDVISLYQQVHNVPFGTAYRYYLEKYGLWTDQQSKSRALSVPKRDKRTKDGKLDFLHYTPMSKTGVEDRDKSDSNALQKYKLGRFWLRGIDAFGKNPLPAQAERSAIYDLMQLRYGLTVDSIIERGYGWDQTSRRLIIPVEQMVPGAAKPALSVDIPSLVNLRFHDIARLHCWWVPTDGGAAWHNVDRKSLHQEGAYPPGLSYRSVMLQDYGDWNPVYKAGDGRAIPKSLSVAGRGSAYLYNWRQLLDNESVYLTGGELKADLLVQMGLPAVAYTAGEGTDNSDFFPYFIGKRIRVLLDADPSAPRDHQGYSLADLGAVRLAKNLLLAGAEEVVWGFWPESTRELLPPKGDITDLLVRNRCNPQVLETMIQWQPVERPSIFQGDEAVVVEVQGEAPPEEDEIPLSAFTDLTTPAMLDKWARVRAMIAGESPDTHAIPHTIHAECSLVIQKGTKHLEPKCGQCRMPKLGGNQCVKLGVEPMLEMIGVPPAKIKGHINSLAGIPKGCDVPAIKIDYASAKRVVITPALNRRGEPVPYSHQSAFMLSKARPDLQENVGYDMTGKVLQDPRTGAFAFAATKWRRPEGDIFTYQRQGQKALLLRNHLTDEPREAYRRLLGSVEKGVIRQVFNQSDMIGAILLTFFLPFHFTVGGHENETVSPHVILLGEAGTGKSSVISRLMTHYGVGRLASSETDLTFAGLIGGNYNFGSQSLFRWGLLPNSHRSILGLDEMNKLPPEMIGKLTSIISTGVANRTTNSGARETNAWVRLISSANPRGGRKMSSYPSPLDALTELVGSPQDLRRVEFAFFQGTQKDDSSFTRKIGKHVETDSWYTEDLARYHLQWAWHLKAAQIRYRDPTDIFERALTLSKDFSDHPLIMRSTSRFKLARLAAGFAIMTYSASQDDIYCDVEPEHVQMAEDFLRARYEPCMTQSFSVAATTLTMQACAVLDGIKDVSRLQFLLKAKTFSQEELMMALRNKKQASQLADAFLFGETTYWQISTSMGRYRWSDEALKLGFQSYLDYRKEASATANTTRGMREMGDEE